MKKSLILSVVMTLVLVISMSTATFAWYTANNQVTATVSNIEAASASGDLQIAMSEQDAEGQTAYAATRTFADDAKVVKPIAPNASLAGLDNAWTQGTWKGWNLAADGTATENGATFGNDVVTGTITLSNASTSATGAISVVVDVSGTNADNTEVVLVYDNTIVYSSAYNYGGAAVNGDNKLDAATTAAAIEGSALADALTSIANGAGATLTYYIWFDGFTLTNAGMGKIANVKFTFTAAPVNA